MTETTTQERPPLAGVSTIRKLAEALAGKPYADWPDLSRSETLILALILDDVEVLDAEGVTALQAVEEACQVLPLSLLLHLQTLHTDSNGK